MDHKHSTASSLIGIALTQSVMLPHATPDDPNNHDILSFHSHKNSPYKSGFHPLRVSVGPFDLIS